MKFVADNEMKNIFTEVDTVITAAFTENIEAYWFHGFMSRHVALGVRVFSSFHVLSHFCSYLLFLKYCHNIYH